MLRRMPKAIPREVCEFVASLGFEELVMSEISSPFGPSEDRGSEDKGFESVASRELELAQLGQQVETCQRCRLAQSRSRVVFGSGSVQARLMVIGEGPGEEEDRRGLPFVGRAGELLTRILASIDLKREQVYIANVVKCRPPKNREPLPDEVAACRSYLEHQIELVKPAILLLLGRVAAQTLLGVPDSLARLRGSWFEVRGIPTRVTYHPAALLRNPQLKRPTWEDVQLVRDRLQELCGGQLCPS